MSFYGSPQVKLLFQKMQHTQARQEVASDNISRMGIADEKTKDVESFEKAVKRGQQPKSIHTTNVNHMQGRGRQTGFDIKTTKASGPTSLSGNNIGHQQQLLNLDQATTDFYRFRQINSNMTSRAKAVYTLGSK